MKYIFNYAVSIACAIMMLVSVTSLVKVFAQSPIDPVIIIFDFFMITIMGSLSIMFLISGILKQIKEEKK